MKTYILTVAILLSAIFCSAQQNPVMSHYMFNGLLLNPAYAGTKEYVSTSFLFRKQWTGFEGAPVTQTASIHGPLKNKKIGLGFIIENDHIGVTNKTDFYLCYSYHLPINTGKLCMGLQGGLSYYKSKLSDLKYWDSSDPVFELETQTSLQPNFGAGAYYFVNRWYAGISVPYLLSYDPEAAASIKSDNVYKQSRDYYLNAGAVWDLNLEVKIKPSVLIKYVHNTSVQYDLNVNFLFNNIFWVGASYRSKDAVVAMIEYQVSRKMRIGYSYDYSITKIGNYSGGSHEIMLGYDFGYDIMKIKNPRYF